MPEEEYCRIVSSLQQQLLQQQEQHQQAEQENDPQPTPVLEWYLCRVLPRWHDVAVPRAQLQELLYASDVVGGQVGGSSGHAVLPMIMGPPA